MAARGLIAPAALPEAAGVAVRYAIGVSEDVAALIDPNDAADPIARQYLPDPRELTTRPEERLDPIGDAAHSPCEGLVHRYPDRVLLKLVDVCAVYCRFCFRREMVGPGGGGALAPAALDAAMAYVVARPHIWEVILTGGDPLAASPRRLADVAERLAAIPHVKILRVHTRLPVAAPERVRSDLIDALMRSGKRVYVAVHANHPRELTPAARSACARLAAAGCVLISQSVLLRGVNDDPGVLASLMRGFVEAGIKPYYLHHPDLAPGTSHFRLGLARVRRWSPLCAAASPAYASRITYSIFPAATARSPSGHPTSTMAVCAIGRAARTPIPPPARRADRVSTPSGSAASRYAGGGARGGRSRRSPSTAPPSRSAPPRPRRSGTRRNRR